MTGMTGMTVTRLNDLDSSTALIAHCRECAYHAPYNRESLIKALGENPLLSRIREKATCGQCGSRNVLVQIVPRYYPYYE